MRKVQYMYFSYWYVFYSGEKVLVAGGASKDDIVDLPSEFLTLFLRNSKLSSIISTLVPAIPDP